MSKLYQVTPRGQLEQVVKRLGFKSVRDFILSYLGKETRISVSERTGIPYSTLAYAERKHVETIKRFREEEAISK